ncbi:hypothetical protein [Streptomyces fumanus]|uniref:Uncharacterized protein n=1 Tax=Streptomyces fumanus TaxID=67302 RepID=A0A919EB84_9ACTN|nr:hypothetical protein [Streptomyces fumanus]GHF32756.1 hypothetical protein GCM10018772_68050 [Streptomyces fumanus]
MGWTVLYIAFGIVALWLLGEVLLQYKARLRWRLLAFAGFLGVVAGVAIASVVVIGLGAAAFAVGQTYVTLSFRRGFASGWAVNAPAGLVGSKRRRPERGHQEPPSEVPGPDAAAPGHDAPAPDHGAGAYDHDHDRDDVFTPARPADPTAAETTAVYAPQPMPEDSASYDTYGGAGYGHDQHAPAADASYAYDPSGYPQQGYGYDGADQQQYAAYSDPYIGGAHTYGGAPYGTGYDTGAGAQPPYGSQEYPQSYPQDPYATGGYGDQTPAGGVWVPQQRSTDGSYGGELPPEQPYPPYHGDGQGQGQGQNQGQSQGHGFDEQYRF